MTKNKKMNVTKNEIVGPIIIIIMNVNVILIIIVVLGTVPKGMVRGLEVLDMQKPSKLQH